LGLFTIAMITTGVSVGMGVNVGVAVNVATGLVGDAPSVCGVDDPDGRSIALVAEMFESGKSVFSLFLAFLLSGKLPIPRTANMISDRLTKNRLLMNETIDPWRASCRLTPYEEPDASLRAWKPRAVKYVAPSIHRPAIINRIILSTAVTPNPHQ
jgi:hypothetical protein